MLTREASNQHFRAGVRSIDSNSSRAQLKEVGQTSASWAFTIVHSVSQTDALSKYDQSIKPEQAENRENDPASAGYDTREKEKILSWNKIGNLDCLGENLEFASIPESGECHGR